MELSIIFDYQDGWVCNECGYIFGIDLEEFSTEDVEEHFKKEHGHE